MKLVWLAIGVVAFILIFALVLKMNGVILFPKNDISGWFSLIISSAIGIYVTFAILIYSDAYQKQIQEFAQEQQLIKEVKQKRYSLIILFGLRQIEYEIDGMVVHQRFRDSKDSDERRKYDKQIQINYYQKAQKRFLDMGIEYDTILEIFSEKIENQYRQAWNVIRTQTIYVDFDKSDKLWETINKMARAFEELRNSIIEYVDEATKKDYSDLFDLTKYRKNNNEEPRERKTPV